MSMRHLLVLYGHFYFVVAVRCAVTIAVCVLVWFFPRLGQARRQNLEGFFSRLAAQRHAALGLAFFVPIVIRVLLLPVIGVPYPYIHDEHSYLLMADTFVHGRLANPPHPMWLSFETFHENFWPTYSSIFPPAQGLVLAVGQLLGHPWIGVLLSVGAMCAALVWMLQAWMPSRWALLGGFLAIFNLSIVSYWINSYWGGAVAAIGGALVLGALPRIQRRQRIRDSLLLGLGIAILANSRMLEGLVFCLPVAAALLLWLGGKSSPPLRKAARTVIAPLAAVLLVTFAFIGYYNWRLTGDPFLLPHALNLRLFSTPLFLWQKLQPPLHYHNRQFEDYYNGWLRHNYLGAPLDIVRVSSDKVRGLASMFLWTGALPLFLALPFALRDRRVRFLVIEFVVCLAGLFTVVYSLPHYAAPLTCVIYALVVQSVRHLRTLRYRGRATGAALARVAVALLVAGTGVSVYHLATSPVDGWASSADAGGKPGPAAIEQQLRRVEGKHLILARYGASHSPHREWVYNHADIDGSKIVWARELDAEQNTRLLHYFAERKVWLVEPDHVPIKLQPYSGRAAHAD
jgi:hypothetical protein